MSNLQILDQAQSIKVIDPISLTQASAIYSKLKEYFKKTKAEEDSLTERPLGEIAKIRAIFKPKRDRADALIKYVYAEISAYQTAEALRVKQEEAKIAARIGEGKGHLKIETAVAKFDAIEKPVESVATGAGTIKFRTDKVLRITDKSLIPLEYMEPNENAIKRSILAGASVPGCVLEEVQTVVNYGK